jgi:hypothetical protein
VLVRATLSHGSVGQLLLLLVLLLWLPDLSVVPIDLLLLLSIQQQWLCQVPIHAASSILHGLDARHTMVPVLQLSVLL